MKKGFSIAANDRSCPGDAKKKGGLYLANQLLRAYFQMSRVVLGRNVIKAVEGPVFPDWKSCPKRDAVTYSYYVGSVALYVEEFKRAEDFLDYAAQHCHKLYIRNMHLILRRLIPIKMLFGHMPRPEFLKKHGFDDYGSLREALLMGNLSLFEETINAHAKGFYRDGLYVLIERLKFVLYRNLIKKV